MRSSTEPICEDLGREHGSLPDHRHQPPHREASALRPAGIREVQGGPAHRGHGGCAGKHPDPRLALRNPSARRATSPRPTSSTSLTCSGRRRPSGPSRPSRRQPLRREPGDPPQPRAHARRRLVLRARRERPDPPASPDGSPTWDHGIETAFHRAFTITTDIPVHRPVPPHPRGPGRRRHRTQQPPTQNARPGDPSRASV